MCLYPTLLRNKKYAKNKKNKGQPPLVYDTRTLYVPIGCDNCAECRNRKAREWQIRLTEDIKEHKNGKFITFTFSNQSITKLVQDNKDLHGIIGYALDNAIATKAVRLFLERWRKKYTKSLRHWLVTELGHEGTENIHLHGIIWTDENLKEVEDKWQYGFMWKGQETSTGILNYVTTRTVNYITKYITKQDLDHKLYKSKTLCSPGIGAAYLKRFAAIQNEWNGSETRDYYVTESRHKMSLPIYYRNKIYTDEERELLWLMKLDKCERYVWGEKVSVKYSDDEYWRLLKYYRRKNAKLGYGNYNKDWSRAEYEQQRREMLHGQRGIIYQGKNNYKPYNSGLEEHYNKDYFPEGNTWKPISKKWEF